MNLKNVTSILEKKLEHYPKDSARGGDTYDNGMHHGLNLAIKLIKKIDKKEKNYENSRS